MLQFFPSLAILVSRLAPVYSEMESNSASSCLEVDLVTMLVFFHCIHIFGEVLGNHRACSVDMKQYAESQCSLLHHERSSLYVFFESAHALLDRVRILGSSKFLVLDQYKKPWSFGS